MVREKPPPENSAITTPKERLYLWKYVEMKVY